MKKLWTSALSFLLVIIMIGGAAPLTLGAQNATYKVGDIVKYGSYPQSDVTASLGSVLNSQTGTWKSYGCFSGSGRNDGTQAASNIMRYKDVTYNGTKYRGVTFDKYRPDATYETASTSGKYMPQYENGYTCNKVYWFKFEPIAWRVLNPSSGLIMCEQIMDSQPFNPYDHRGSEYFFSSNYAESTIRNWLINDFYNTAFSTKQKENILTTLLNNDCAASLSGNSGFERCNAPQTKDKVFLLGYDQVTNAAFGFDSNAENNDSARALRGSAYAKCQGLRVMENGKSTWWERSSTSVWNYVCCVDEDGEAGYCNEHVLETWVGVCPAVCLKDMTSINGSTSGYDLGDDTYSFKNYGYDAKTRKNPCSEKKCKITGHCFGMAVTSSAFYLNILSKGANENTPLYDFPQSGAIMSTIHFYQKRQDPLLLDIVSEAGHRYWASLGLNKDINKDWNEVISFVKQHSYDNRGNLVFDLHFRNGNCHSTNFLRYDKVDGQDRVYVYDNNFPFIEVYFYKGSDLKVYEYIPNLFDPSLEGSSFEVDSVGLFNVNKYFAYVDQIETRDMIFAPINTIKVDDIKAFPICQGDESEEYVVFKVPSDKSSVTITPLVDNAEFEYLDETYSFGKIDEKTTATFVLSTSEETNNATFSLHNTSVKIMSPSHKKIRFGDTLVLHAEANNLPAGAQLVWSVENASVITIDDVDVPCAVPDHDRNCHTCKIGGKARGTTKITCTVCDASGNPIKCDEVEVSDSIEMKSRRNIFMIIFMPIYALFCKDYSY